MSETDLYFKINEYLIGLETKNDLIKELNNELQNLEIKNKELLQKKGELIEKYNKEEKNKKSLINLYSSITHQENINIKKNNNKAKKKRNFSAGINRRTVDIDSIRNLRKKNAQLNNILINYKIELNNIVKEVNEMEINCKLMMSKANFSKFLFK